MRKLRFVLMLFMFALVLVGCDTNTTQKDLVPPSFNGTKDITYYVGSSEIDYLNGVSAVDSIDGDLTSSITVNDTDVDLTNPGVYTLTYVVSDLSGNEISTSVSIIVILIEQVVDSTPPVIIGASSFTYYIDGDEPDYLGGLVAFDPEDGALTADITVDTTDVDLTTVGIYDVIYAVSDQAGNLFSITVQVTVIDLQQNQSPDHLNIYYINDFHGSILEDGDEMGLSNMANLILNEKAISPMNTIFIGGGDILQGSLLSNYFDGSSTMDILNNMQMDAFTIGNHEFDWGFDVITNFRDPSSGSLQADFPLLGANIFLDGTTTRPTNIDAYTIIEKGDVKVGVIGVIGAGLEDSIATSKITGYYFDDPVYWTAHYAEYLRDVEQVDVVLAVIHDNGVSSGYNQSMSSLTGNQRIDAVFNGHSHSTYAQYLTRTGVRMPYLQSGSNGTNLGKVTLELDSSRQVTNAFVENLTGFSDARLTESNTTIDAVIETYVSQIQPLLEDEIITSGAYISTTALTYYMAELIRLASDSDIGFHNSGGTRAPLRSGQKITIATLYEIFPFDNKIKTVWLSGASINSFKNSSYGSYNSTRVDDMIFEDNLYYKAATNDYVFDSTNNPFIYGDDIEDTGILIRDILEAVMRNQKEAGFDTFLITNPIVLSQSSSLEFALYLPKKNTDDLYITI